MNRYYLAGILLLFTSGGYAQEAALKYTAATEHLKGRVQMYMEYNGSKLVLFDEGGNVIYRRDVRKISNAALDTVTLSEQINFYQNGRLIQTDALWGERQRAKYKYNENGT